MIPIVTLVGSSQISWKRLDSGHIDLHPPERLATERYSAQSKLPCIDMARGDAKRLV